MRAAIRSIVFLAIVALAATAGAQPGGGGGRGGGGRGGQGGGQGGQPPALPDSAGIVQIVDEMADAVVLTDEQYVQVTDLHFAHFAEVQGMMAQGRPERSKMEALRSEFEKDVKAVLREDQQGVYDKYLSSRQRQRGGGRGR